MTRDGVPLIVDRAIVLVLAILLVVVGVGAMVLADQPANSEPSYRPLACTWEQP